MVAGGGGGGNALGTAGGAAGSPGATGALAPSSQPFCTGGNGGSQGTASAGGAGGARGTFGNNPHGTAGADGQLGEGGSGGGDAYGGGGGGGGGLFGGGGGASATGDFNVQTVCRPGGGGGGSSGFFASATGTSVSPDTSGVPSLTLEWTAAPSPPSGPGGRDTVAPTVSALSLSRTAFVAANFGPPAVAAAKVGTTVSYRVSEAARVTFKVERPKPGIRRGGRCVKRTRKAPASARKCTRWVQVKGSFAQDAATGANSIRFMGRLRGRALRAGRYRLVVVARDAAGNAAAKPARRSFRIV